MRYGSALALSLAVVPGACSSGGSSVARSSTDANIASHTGASSGPSATGVLGGGGCPDRADAASCPAAPAWVDIPTPPPNGPPTLEPGYWVGCEFTGCSSQTSCTTCTCVAADGGGAWECASNNGFRPDTDAAPTPYCALYAGPLDADVPDVGPVEQCTPERPTCTPPLPESPGWQCCQVSRVGGLTEYSCTSNDSGASGSGSPYR